jgi:predicted ATPase/DNA-binding SARP family transcriptional activator
MAESVFRLWLFGDVRGEIDGKPVRIALRPLCAVLLAMLVVRPGTRLDRRALAAELWPDEADPARANGNLRRHLSTLQSALPPLENGESWIESDGVALIWSTRQPLWCDATAFENALAATDADPEAFMDKGDFMRGHASEWVIAARESYRARAVARLLEICIARQDDDRILGALACSEAALRMDPFCEEAVQLTIELYGERGDAVSAGQVYATFAERLRRELDAQPALETTASIERVRSLAHARRERLPRAMTSFVGRNAAVDGITSALENHRCVTILGPGGLGKTRLSLETARAVASRYIDGSYFVDLSTIGSGAPILDAVVRALALPGELARDGAEGVKRFLRNRRALLIFDNCEHVRDACAALAYELLEHAPRITILATSRVALGLRAEICYRLKPLSEGEARALFIERTRGASADSDVWSAEEVACIDRIAAMLDRSPLAIELAAGLCASMAPGDIERRLPDRFEMLRTSDPSMPERHRTYEATIAWSYELLSVVERRLFDRLAVFPSSFTFDAALAICGESPEALRGLVEKSMLQRDEVQGDRYRLLFSLADFARRNFATDPGAADVRERHARHFAHVALFGENPETPEFFRGEQSWLKSVESDIDNIRAGLRYLLRADGTVAEAELGIRNALALERYFAMRGYFAEGHEWLEAARKRTVPGSHTEARVRYKIGRFAMRLGRIEEAFAALGEAAAYFRSTSAEVDVAHTLADLGAIAFSLADLEAAESFYSEALALSEELNLVGAKGAVLGNVGVLAMATGDTVRAQDCFREAAALFKRQGDRRFLARMLDSLACCEIVAGRFASAIDLLQEAIVIARSLGAVQLIADVLCNLGEALAADGRLAQARDCLAEALALVAPFGMALETAHAFLGFANLAAVSGDAATAARLCGAAAVFIARNASTKLPNSLYQRTREAAVAQLGEAEFERQRQRGELLEIEAAIALTSGVGDEVFHRIAGY